MLVLDNYAIHKTKAVQDWLELHRDDISVLWFPTYAPNLNPVEKIWWYLKKRFLKHMVFADMGDLKSYARRCFRYLGRHTEVIRSLTGIRNFAVGVT